MNRFTSYFSLLFIRTSLYFPGSSIPVSETCFFFTMSVFQPLKADLKWPRFLRRALRFRSLQCFSFDQICFRVIFCGFHTWCKNPLFPCSSAVGTTLDNSPQKYDCKKMGLLASLYKGFKLKLSMQTNTQLSRV